MSTPRQILQRPTVKQEVQAPAKPAEPIRRVAVPQPIRRNSVYRQLMKSHDRVSTRHIKG